MATVIKGKLLIDATGGPPLPGGVVVVDRDRILAVGTAGEIVAPPGATVIDRREDTLLPGLVDPHTHIAFNSRRGESLIVQGSVGPVALALRATQNLLEDLDMGVTTMRGLGDVESVDLAIRDAVASGEVPGPRLLACARPLRPSHGTASPIGVNADGVEGLRRAIRENIAMGADVIKLFVSNIRTGETTLAYRMGDLTRVPAYTREEIAAAVDEAHRSGVRVAAHALGGPALGWALEAGVDSIEHANLMGEEDIEGFLAAGAWISDPNLQLFLDHQTGFPARPDYHNLPWWREKVDHTAEVTRTVIPQAVKAGVKISLGTDCNHGGLWKEARLLAGLGIPPMDVIVAVTRSGAELCGLADKVGTLQPGKLADVIAVRGNPLEDMSVMRDVTMVMKEGRLYK